MAPFFEKRDAPVVKPSQPEAVAIEAWAQGYMVGSLVVMACLTVANLRRRVLLHKLILLELIMGTFHGTFILMEPPVYGWYLSVTAIFLNASWSLHNVIAWIKTRPFLSRKWSMFYIGTVILAQPYWVLEIYANFTYFNNINDLFVHTRPYEAIFRDPWWIFTTINLFYNITTRYSLSLFTVVKISPRFGVLLGAMILSVIFIILDICSVTHAFSSTLPDGLNPFWKLAFVFKCLTDSIILDDFKTALDRLMRYKWQREEATTGHTDQATFGGATAATEDVAWSPVVLSQTKEDPLSDANMESAGRRHRESNNTDMSARPRRDSLASIDHIVQEKPKEPYSPTAKHVDHYDDLELNDPGNLFDR